MGRKPTPIAAPETLPTLDAAVIADESQALTEVGARDRLQSSSLEVGKLDGQQKRLPAVVVPLSHYDPKKSRPQS